MSGSIDSVVHEIVLEAQRALRLRRVIIFGSHGRGDAKPHSDIDLAFEHDSDDAAWAAFVNEMADRAPTLLSLDLVDLTRASPSLSARIHDEGRVVYG